MIINAHEDLDGRKISFWLSDVVSDGGQWNMIVSLVEKYGLVPKSVFPESANGEASRDMNQVLRSKLREAAFRLRGAEPEQRQALRRDYMKEIFRIVTTCLGSPPTHFSWEARTKDKKGFVKFQDMTPLQFYAEHVKPVFNFAEKVCLIHDPRPSHNFGQTYSVERLGNVVGDGDAVYLNLSSAVLKKLAMDAIVDDQPVWFGCDVGKDLDRAGGVMDPRAHDLPLLLGTPATTLTKAERLLAGDGVMTHAMVFTAVATTHKSGVTVPTRWRVENSWGNKNGDEG